MNAYAYSAICAAVLIPLELLFPLRQKRLLRRGITCDICHLGLNTLLLPLGLGMVAVALTWISDFIPREIPAFMNQLPLWIQGIILFLLAETMFYAAHRLVHAVPLLWRFHAIHHSSEELDFLSAIRGHPIDTLIHWSLVMAPLILLDLPVGIFATYTIVFYIHSYIVHANLRFRIPLMDKVVVTPDFHHSHHEKSGRHNYAGILSLLDGIFRSRLRNPEQHPRCQTTSIPAHYAAQLVFPFLPRRSSDRKANSNPLPEPPTAQQTPAMEDK